MEIDWTSFLGQVTFILGAAKSAGKTTFLKYALACLRERGAGAAYLSVGVEGEAGGPLNGNGKSLVRAAEGDQVVTGENAWARSEARAEIREVFPGRTVLGRPVLGRVRRGGIVELTGPAHNRQLGEILRHLTAECGIKTILVDGAMDRITQLSAATGGLQAGFVMTLRVNPANLARSAQWVRLMDLLRHIPAADAAAACGAVALDGALTAHKRSLLPAAPAPLVLEDFTKVFLGYGEMAGLCRERPVFFRNRHPLRFVVADLMDVDRGEFLAALGPSGETIPVVFNPYLAERSAA